MALLSTGPHPEVEVASACQWGRGTGQGAGLGLEVLVTQGSEGRVPGGQLGQHKGKGSAAELLQQMGSQMQDL